MFSSEDEVRSNYKHSYPLNTKKDPNSLLIPQKRAHPKQRSEEEENARPLLEQNYD